MIERATFHRYRGFEHLSVDLAPSAFIVGPNSAGKSTVIEAVALAELCLRRARREGSKLLVLHRDEVRRAWTLPRRPSEDGEDPVRYEFGNAEASVTFRWSGGAALHMVWPAEDDERQAPFFYLEATAGKAAPASTVAVKAAFSSISVIPVVTPLDRLEEVKSVQYISRLEGSRLASRHFRNHAWEMQRRGDWPEFRDFVAEWLPEIELLNVELLGSGHLGIFYREGASRVPKELAWAGDGIQIWLQLLWHLYKARDTEAILLDEPEVYLHPDLQRRLVRLLEQLSVQVIMASHSADVIAEAPPDSIVWVDRRTNTSRRAKGDRAFSALSASLGTAFNLAVARAQRTRLVVATDCDDIRVLQTLARRVGALNLAADSKVTFVQLKETARWEGREGLGAAIRQALPPGLPAVILLQRGQRSIYDVNRLRRVLAAPNVELVFLDSAELDNYLLDPEALALASGAAPLAIAAHLDRIIGELAAATRSRYVAAAVAAGYEESTRDVVDASGQEFDALWTTAAGKRSLVRGSDVLDGINAWLERDGYRCVTALSTARALKGPELPAEILETLLWLDRKADAA